MRLFSGCCLDITNEYIINNIEDFATVDIIESIGVEVVDEIHNNLPALEKQIQEVEEKPVVDNNVKTEKKSAMDKAIETTDAHDLLDDLTEDDIEDGFYDDIF